MVVQYFSKNLLRIVMSTVEEWHPTTKTKGKIGRRGTIKTARFYKKNSAVCWLGIALHLKSREYRPQGGKIRGIPRYTLNTYYRYSRYQPYLRQCCRQRYSASGIFRPTGHFVKKQTSYLSKHSIFTIMFNFVHLLH